MIWCRRRAAKQARADFQKLAGGKLSWIEGESLTADGRAVPVEVRAGRIEYGGQPALLFHVRDITERRAAETALQSSETLFRSVWENSVDGMRLTDENGIIVAVNDAFCQLVGLKPGRTGRQAVHDRLCRIRGPGAMMLKQHRDSFASRRRRTRTSRSLHAARRPRGGV